MIRLSVFTIFFFICFVGCVNDKNTQSKNSQYAFLDSISCDSCLHILIYTSELDKDLKNKKMVKDGISDSSLLIKIYHENEAEKGAVFDAADCFLEINLKNKRLLKDVLETNSAIEIKCDKYILNYYIKHCIDSFDWK